MTLPAASPAPRLSARATAYLVAFFVPALVVLYLLVDMGGPVHRWPVPRAVLQGAWLYLVAIFLAVPVYHFLPRTLRPYGMLAMSLAFLALVISPSMATWSLGAALVLLGIVWLVPHVGWPALGLFAGWVGIVYSQMPACLGELSASIEWMPLAFGVNVLVVGIVMRTFHRATFAFYESWIGRETWDSPCEFVNYLIGLPFMTNSVSPSPRHFLDSRQETPEGLETTVIRGVKTCALCVGCLLMLSGLGWLQKVVPLGYPSGDFGPEAGQKLLSCSRPELWWIVLTYYFLHYLRRMGGEQLSVGAWRLFGHDLRDNFISPMTAHDLLDYWRRWDVLWREFLMSAFYYPVLMRLGRRYGAGRAWIYPVAGWVTFMANFVFDYLPRGLFVVLTLPPQALDFLCTMLVYHGAWSVLAGGSLYLQARHRGPAVRHPAWRVALHVALTYATVTFLRLFEISNVPLQAKMLVLRQMFS